MKKLFLLFIPLVAILLCFMFADAGLGSWTNTLTGTAIWQACIVVNPTNQQIIYAGSASGGIYETTNSGVNWININNSLSLNSLAISYSNPSVLYAGTASSGIYKSTDAGLTWNAINTGISEPSYDCQAIAIKPTDPNTAVACFFTGALDATYGVYKTTNGGTSWSVSNTGIGSMKNFLSMMVNPVQPNTIYMGSSFNYAAQTGPCYIYKSFDFGSTWTSFSNGLGTATTSTDVIRILSYSTVDTNTVLAGLFFNTTNGGPYLTTNAGGLWVQKAGGIGVTTVPGPTIRSIQIRPGSNTEFYLGGGYGGSLPPGGVWRTTNAGTTWADFNSGSLSAQCTTRALSFRVSPDSTILAGVEQPSSNAGVHLYTWNLVGIPGNSQNVPKDFALHQNYPNPFNPSTMIVYDIPKGTNVSIDLYDIAGRLVKNIVNGYRDAGTYSVNFNAASLSSGIYFYKLTAGNFVETKKMTLVK